MRRYMTTICSHCGVSYSIDLKKTDVAFCCPSCSAAFNPDKARFVDDDENDWYQENLEWIKRNMKPACIECETETAEPKKVAKDYIFGGLKYFFRSLLEAMKQLIFHPFHSFGKAFIAISAVIFGIATILAIMCWLKI